MTFSFALMPHKFSCHHRVTELNCFYPPIHWSNLAFYFSSLTCSWAYSNARHVFLYTINCEETNKHLISLFHFISHFVLILDIGYISLPICEAVPVGESTVGLALVRLFWTPYTGTERERKTTWAIDHQCHAKDLKPLWAVTWQEKAHQCCLQIVHYSRRESWMSGCSELLDTTEQNRVLFVHHHSPKRQENTQLYLLGV